MAVRLSETPGGPDEFTGRPIMLPFVLFCTNGERWCGWQRTANSSKEFVLLAADRRVHESSCKGGLILATSLSDIGSH